MSSDVVELVDELGLPKIQIFLEFFECVIDADFNVVPMGVDGFITYIQLGQGAVDGSKLVID